MPWAWASRANALLGIWLIVSPWVLGYSGTSTGLWGNVVLGILVLIAAATAGSATSAGPSWWTLAFGIWLIISPFVLSYWHDAGAAANDVVCGIILTILALFVATVKSDGSPTGRAA